MLIHADPDPIHWPNGSKNNEGMSEDTAKETRNGVEISKNIC
jgi:hypothetical protein